MPDRVGLSVCPSDPELLRAAQCDDAEIKAHMFMHSKGLCPVTQDEAREEYEHMVGVFRGNGPACDVMRGDGSIPQPTCILPVGHEGPHYG